MLRGEHLCHLFFLYFLHVFFLLVWSIPPLEEERHLPVFGLVGPWLPSQQQLYAPEIQHQGRRVWGPLCSNIRALTPMGSHSCKVPKKRSWCLRCDPWKGNSWDVDGCHLRQGMASIALRGWCEDTCSAALSFTWWGSVHPLVQWKWEQPDPCKLDRITSYHIWLTPCSLECRFLFNVTRTNSSGCVRAYICPCQGLYRGRRIELAEASKGNASAGHLRF